MHIIIIGAGEVGEHLAKILTDEQQDVYVIEQDEKLARLLDEKLDAQVIHGTGISRAALFRAGISRADLLLAVTRTDEVNLVAAMTAERLHPECRTVARVRDTRFLHGTDAINAEEYGVDLLLGPEQAVAEQVVKVLQYAGPGQISSLANGSLTLLELPVAPHSALAFASLEELTPELPEHTQIVAALGDHELRILEPAARFHVGERVIVLCAPGEVSEILALVGSDTHHVKRVLIVGAGDIGLHVAQALQRLKFNVTIIEHNFERAGETAVKLSRSTVICENGIEPSTLSEQIRDGHDAIVVLIDDDSKSLLAGITAKHLGGKKVIARVDNPEYGPIARKLGVDALISPRRAVADTILSFVRKSTISSTTTLGNQQGEILDFRVKDKPNRKLTDNSVEQLKLPENSRIGMILRGEEILVPRSEGLHIQAKDHVFVVALRDAVSKLEELFG